MKKSKINDCFRVFLETKNLARIFALTAVVIFTAIAFAACEQEVDNDFTITGIPNAAAGMPITVYACSKQPESTQGVSTTDVPTGTVNSGGTIRWSTEPSDGAYYYVVLYFNKSYYKYPDKIMFSGEGKTLEWSKFSALETGFDEGKWLEGGIMPGETRKYSFRVYLTGSSAYPRTKTFYFWWNDRKEGDGTKKCDIRVRGRLGNGVITGWQSEGSDTIDSAWENAVRVTLRSETVAISTLTLIVEGYDSSESGDFAICYTETNERPSTP
ncbi:MAG: hypothetical protein LBG72_10650 [Spirochaetaceae bacterium]|jgi:hypothetical protein|nr:hypothetical protein [Spirochaetaceae bacterium]